MGAGWLAGVGINLVGSIMINLGTNVMKMGHNKLAMMPATGPGHAIYKLREWQIGVSLFTIGNVANFVSFGYAAQSLLAAIGCIQFVSNVVFASVVLKEQVSRGVLIATAFIVAGCVLLVSCGSHTSEKYTFKDLLHLYSQPAYIIYLSLGGAAVVGAYGCYWIGQKAIIAKAPCRSTQMWSAALPILYSIFSALIGTQSVLFSKTLAVLLRSTVTGDNQLNKWFTWLVLVAFFTTAVFWVTRLNKGLRMFPALIIVPSLQICWTLFSILSGMLYFQEYKGMKAASTALFVLGVAVVFLGVFLLTRASQPSPVAGGSSGSPESVQLRPKSQIAYVGDTVHDDSAGSSAVELTAAKGQAWELAAVRPQQSEAGLDTLAVQPSETEGWLGGRHGSRLLQQQQQRGTEEHEDEYEASDDEEYERALLAGTTRGSLHNSSHIQPQLRLQPQGSVGLRSGKAGPEQPQGGAAAASITADSQGPQQSGSALAAAAKRLRPRQEWLAKASSFKRRMVMDFSMDETAVARLSLGLGDSHMPGFSLFTLPMVDISAVQQEGSNGGAGRPYGRLPASSWGGVAPVQGVPDFGAHVTDDGTGCISHAGANRISGSLLRSHQSCPTGHVISIDAQEGVAALGPGTGINPLANAIDIKTSGSGSVKAVAATASGESGPGTPTRKLRNIQAALKSNLQDFSATIQNAAATAAGSSKGYARMTSKDEVLVQMTDDTPEQQQ